MTQTKKVVGLVAMYTLVYLAMQEIVLRFIVPHIPKFAYSDKFYLTIEVMVVCILFTIAKVKKVNISEQIKSRKISLKTGFIALLIGCSTAIFTGVMLDVLKGPGFIIEYGGWGLLFFFAYHAFNSVYKEVYFRSCIFNTLNKRWTLLIAILIEGLVYGILFMGFNIPLIISGYFSVIMFTLIYVWVGSIWAGVITQFSSSVLLYLIHSKVIDIVNPQTTIMLVFLGGASLIFSLVWLRMSHTKEVPLREENKNNLWAAGLVAVTIMILMSMCYFIYRIHDILWNTVEGYSEFMQANGNLFTLAYSLLAVIILAILFKKVKGNILKEWYIRAMTPKSTIMITIIALGISVFTTCFTSVRAIKEAFPVFEVYMNAFMNNMPSLPLQILCIISIPIIEEIIFRGIIFRQVEQKTSLVWGLIASIGTYALLQGDIWIGLYSILGSLIYTLCFIYGRSLWGSVAVQVISALFMLVIRRSFILGTVANLNDGILVLLCVFSIGSVLGAFAELVKEYNKQNKNDNRLLSKEKTTHVLS